MELGEDVCACAVRGWRAEELDSTLARLSQGCLVGQWGVGACVLRPVCSSGGGDGGGGSGLRGSGWARGERTGSNYCVRASWNRSLLKWQMIWTSRQEMQGPQPPSQCSAQHYVRMALWCSKDGHVRLWRCPPPRLASTAMPRLEFHLFTSCLPHTFHVHGAPGSKLSSALVFYLSLTLFLPTIQFLAFSTQPWIPFLLHLLRALSLFHRHSLVTPSPYHCVSLTFLGGPLSSGYSSSPSLFMAFTFSVCLSSFQSLYHFAQGFSNPNMECSLP